MFNTVKWVRVCEKSLRQKTVQRKSGLEANGLKMNIGKTKVMFGCSVNYRVVQKGKWPGGVCKKEVGNNLILSYICKWINKRYSSVKARQSFICRCCKVDRPVTESQVGFILWWTWRLVMGHHWKRQINYVTYEICRMQTENVIQSQISTEIVSWLHYITYKFITRPTCQFASESGALRWRQND